MVDELDALGLVVGRQLDFLRIELAGGQPGLSSPGSSSLSRTTAFSPAKPRAESLAWNRTASSTNTTSSTSSSVSSMSRAGSALPRPIAKSGTPFFSASSDAFDSGSPSVVWPSERSTIAVGGAPRSSVSTWRTASPSRDLAARGFGRKQLLLGALDIGRADRPRPAAAPSSRPDRAEPCASFPARGAAGRGP